jgi:hypothetical protein
MLSRLLTAYKVTALKLSSSGAVLKRITKTVGPTVRKLVMVLPKGKYRFQVVAPSGRSEARTLRGSNAGSPSGE